MREEVGYSLHTLTPDKPRDLVTNTEFAFWSKPLLTSGESKLPITIEGSKREIKIDRMVASGGEGNVYLATDQEHHRYVVKEVVLLMPSALFSPDSAQAFLQAKIQEKKSQTKQDVLTHDAMVEILDEIQKLFNNDISPIIQPEDSVCSIFSDCREKVLDKVEKDLFGREKKRNNEQALRTIITRFVANPKIKKMRDWLEQMNPIVQEFSILQQLSGINGVPKAIACVADKDVANPTKKGYQAFYLVEEFIPGRELADVLIQKNIYQGDPLQCLEFISELLVVLDEIHHKKINGKRIVYADLKPENILVDNNGHVKLIDFGISGAEGDKYPAVGTPEFAAPEQFPQYGEEYGYRYVQSDIFAVGKLLFTLFTGKSRLHTWDYEESGKLFLQQIITEVGAPKDITQIIIDIIKGATLLKLGERYQSAEIMLRKVENAIELLKEKQYSATVIDPISSIRRV